MTAYDYPRWTRVVVAPTVVNLAAPTLAEIAAGTDVTHDLIVDGLELERETDMIDATPWRGTKSATRVGRDGFADAALVGLRNRAGDTETLWDLAVRGDPGVLIVRRGVAVATAFAAAQLVECARFRFGRRSTLASTSEAVMFRVPLAITDDEDEAVVTA